MSRAVLTLALVLLVGVSGSAQPLQSFQDLGARVHVGDRVRIITVSGADVTGRVTHLGPHEIAIGTGGRETSFTDAAIREVAVRHRSAVRGALIGAAAGAGVLGIPECNGDPTDQCGEGIIMGVLLGGGAGAMAGALLRHSTTVYRAGEKAAFVSPAFRPHAVAVVAGVRW